jgi:hypothetical protein
MADYFCVLHRPGHSVPALCFLRGESDEDAGFELASVVAEWPDAVLLEVFHNDRLVTALDRAGLVRLMATPPV